MPRSARSYAIAAALVLSVVPCWAQGTTGTVDGARPDDVVTLGGSVAPPDPEVAWTKAAGTKTIIEQDEVDKTPIPRDIWSVLRSVPGILVDRVNVGGSENGRRPGFVGKGSLSANAQWSYDGVPITDMTVPGVPPTFYDLDAFQEITVSTAGNDVRVPTGGIAVDLATKTGTNAFHGSAYGSLANEKMSWFNLPEELQADQRLLLPDGRYANKADHIDRIGDYGANLGGPILRDRLWFWGAYGRQEVRLVSLDQKKDETLLSDIHAKLNWKPGPKDSVSFGYFLGQRTKKGRPGIGPSFGLTEDASALWDESGRYPGPVNGLLRGELQHVLTQHVAIDARYSYFGGGSALADRGAPLSHDIIHQVAKGNYTVERTRAQHSASVEADAFFSRLGGNHALKFGFGYRRVPAQSSTALPGDKIWQRLVTAKDGTALITRDRSSLTRGDYVSAHVADTFTKGRLTLDVGLRLERQQSRTLPSTVAANPAFPDLLPELRDPGGERITWTDLSPRVSAAYAIDESRKTIARASYARYAGQLAANASAYGGLPGASYLEYYWNDTNEDGIAQKQELLESINKLGPIYSGYLDTNDPANPIPIRNRIDPELVASHDQEAVVDLTRQLQPTLSVSAALTWRRSTDLAWTPRIGFTMADYSCKPPVTLNDFSGLACVPSAPVLLGRSFILTNRPDAILQYVGFELSARKRLSNHWLGRLAAAWSHWRESFGGPNAIVDPTATLTNPLLDGGIYAPRGSSEKGDVFLNARWQVTASLLYQLPAGFEIAGALFAREGYPRPIALRLSTAPDPVDGSPPDTSPRSSALVLAVPRLDTLRYPSVVQLDVRLAKSFKLGGSRSATLGVDVFNLLNKNTTLRRASIANPFSFNRFDRLDFNTVEEIMSPRVARVGVRVGF